MHRPFLKILILAFLMAIGMLKTSWAIDCGTCNNTIQGKVCYATDDNKFYSCNGTEWKCLMASGCGGTGSGKIQCWASDSALQGYKNGSFTDIGVGINHACATRANGNAHCWGDAYGAEIMGPSFTSIDGGLVYCVIKDNGDLRCWQGDGLPVSPGYDIPTNATGPFTKMDVGGFNQNVCAIKTNGDVQCWGQYYAGSPVSANITKTGPFIDVSTDYSSTCAIRGNGDAHCWGLNYSASAPASVTGPFTAIAKAVYYTCALKTNGDAQCWGGNAPNVNTSSSIAPKNVTGPFVKITSGYNTMCGLKTNGDVQCWGVIQPQGTQNVTGPFTEIDGGQYIFCGIKP